MDKSKKYGAKFKAHIALLAIRSSESSGDIAARLGISAHLIETWKITVETRASELFRPPSRTRIYRERENKRGRLAPSFESDSMVC